jgi:peptidyl-prolyl cis-trans isomerase A (cyclophilin A)
LKSRRLLLLTILGLALAATASAGTIISVTTPVGAMTLELEDNAKPITVSNFLNYLNTGRYTNLFAHRLDDHFVLQSGGYTRGAGPVQAVESFGMIASEFTSEPRFSNTYGTIAMAQSSGPDSATSQWFINLSDNLFLDAPDRQFTVFGRVVDGFDTLEKFNTDFQNSANGGQGIYRFSDDPDSPFLEVPLLNGTSARENFIFTTVAVVPEPTTLLLLAFVGAALCLHRTATRGKPLRKMGPGGTGPSIGGTASTPSCFPSPLKAVPFGLVPHQRLDEDRRQLLRRVVQLAQLPLETVEVFLPNERPHLRDEFLDPRPILRRELIPQLRKSRVDRREHLLRL